MHHPKMRLFSYAIKDNIIITPKKINNISKMSSSYLQFNSHRLDLALSQVESWKFQTLW